MNDTLNTLTNNKITAILRGYNVEQSIFITQGLINGGINCVEVTFYPSNDNQTAINIMKALKKQFGNDLCLGAGTVLTSEQVILSKNAGADYVVSPNCDANVITTTKQNNLVSIAGAFTPTEIQQAHLLNADVIKLFPAVSLGTNYIKLISSPLNHVNLWAFGGIDLNNIKDFLNAGVKGFGIANALMFKQALQQNDNTIITKTAKQFVDIVKGN